MSVDPSSEPERDPLPGAQPSGLGSSLPAYAWSSPRPPKFQHRYGRHLAFFLATLFTTTFTVVWQVLWAAVGAIVYYVTTGDLANAFAAFREGGQIMASLIFNWTTLAHGLSYSVPVLLILSAHEFGHYFACRRHDVDATLPYFLPAPLPLTGTFGAVIRIREAFPSKQALFDIGVAGPLAGFVVLVPLLYWGVNLSEVGPAGQGGLSLGEPLLWKFFEWMKFGMLPNGQDVYVHPVGLAAWWGMLATALNLLPFGQLDGGHIMYASLGPRSTRLSAATLAVVVLLALRSSSWVVFAVLLAAMAFMFGFHHPRVIDEHEPLDRSRQAIAIIAAVVFVICFTPIPLEMIE